MGQSWSSLSKAGQVGDYPYTNGTLQFLDDRIIFTRDINQTTNYNNGMVYVNANLFKVTKIRVTKLLAWQDYTGGTGSNVLIYLKEI